ncbi:MAG: DsbA family protein [Pikeienuella sp.]
MNRRSMILSVGAVAAATFGGAAWYVSKTHSGANVKRVSPAVASALVRPYSPVLGPKDAPVTIVEFFDPACETCRAFHPIVKDLMVEHGDSVRVVIRYTPLHGEGSEVAIRVLEAARMQHRFEPVLESILGGQPLWASHGQMQPQNIFLLAERAGLDLEAAESQIMAPQTTGVINQDKADLVIVGVEKTPTFFVNGRPLPSFGEQQLRELVADEVARAGS